MRGAPAAVRTCATHESYRSTRQVHGRAGARRGYPGGAGDGRRRGGRAMAGAAGTIPAMGSPRSLDHDPHLHFVQPLRHLVDVVAEPLLQLAGRGRRAAGEEREVRRCRERRRPDTTVISERAAESRQPGPPISTCGSARRLTDPPGIRTVPRRRFLVDAIGQGRSGTRRPHRRVPSGSTVGTPGGPARRSSDSRCPFIPGLGRFRGPLVAASGRRSQLAGGVPPTRARES